VGYDRFQSPNHDRYYREWNSEHRIFHQVLRSSSWYKAFLVGNAVFPSNKYFIYMLSADAILRGYQDNIVDRTQLPLLFSISGKGKQPAKPRRAQRRAVRGVSAQQHGNCCTLQINNSLHLTSCRFRHCPCTPSFRQSLSPGASACGQWYRARMDSPPRGDPHWR